MVTEGTAETSSVKEASETAILTSLFGWSLVPPAPPESTRKKSLTRSNTVMSSASVPPSPTSSRASSVAPQMPPPKLSRQSTGITFRLPSSLTNKPENALLQCELCQRRIGLWAFTTRPAANEATDSQPQSLEKDSVPSTPSSQVKKALPQRAFDILKEHRSYCPYVWTQVELFIVSVQRKERCAWGTGRLAGGVDSGTALWDGRKAED
ncbi:unnamed protein product [Cyclocybe aegerita]|uniref:NuBaID C-terminal domain-containing protein n=1 Tax=Cyclocybe aegerita TaxID=1973307 RepID=A0A8S0VSI1_CYCAE|nr:unnamed protein product [Cyclocybe aegerita]